MEIIKSVLFIASSIVAGICIVVSPEVACNSAIFYVSILSSFLGLDVCGMIKTTAMLPPGEYKEMKIHRYVITTVCYFVLIGIAFYMSKKSGFDYTGLYNVFVSAIFVLVGLLIGGLEGNKIATGTTSASSEVSE